MGTINTELGDNIRQIRTERNMTQWLLAERIAEISGQKVSCDMISKWERGLSMIPAEMAYYISIALGVSSYRLWPHSSCISKKDIDLISIIRSLPDDEKDDLLYLLTEWNGDKRALLKLDVAHAVLSECRRAYADSVIIEAYKDAIRTDDPDMDRRRPVDLQYIQKAFKKLDKE